ncbi:hypothetical protein vseg_019766 [Gypsophila vaccaria]
MQEPLLFLHAYVKDSCAPADSDVNLLYATWDEFKKNNGDYFNFEANLIFIPLLLGEHYFCICIKFVQKKIDIRDHTIYDGPWEDNEAYNLAKTIVHFLSDFLDLQVICEGHNTCYFVICDINSARSKLLNVVESLRECREVVLEELVEKRKVDRAQAPTTQKKISTATTENLEQPCPTEFPVSCVIPKKCRTDITYKRGPAKFK